MVEGVPDNLRGQAQELAENVMWMADKLKDAREIIGKSSVAIPYNNGGGQRGIRKNPAFDGYNALMSSYTKALRQLADMLGAEIEEGGDGELDAIIASAPKTRKPNAD